MRAAKQDECIMSDEIVEVEEKKITFEELGLKPEILKALGEIGFEHPTPIQQKTIPHLIEAESDLIGLAQTGTGKTAAFSLPIIHQVDTEEKSPQAIILSPTRELCLQIANDIKDFTKYLPQLKSVPVYGGASIEKQVKGLRAGAHIIVGTPGRVCDMIRRKKLNLTEVKYVVLDEADEMLSMGFKDELDFILAETPEEKQSLLFSATMPKELRRIAKKYMSDHEEIAAAGSNQGAKNVAHLFCFARPRDRYPALKRIADIHPEIYGIVFCRTRAETKDVAEKLMGDGYSADALHGDLSQAQRSHVMHKFRSKHIQILVATDVAARGIDVNNLTHVIHYGLPENSEAYIHRSGRTGRAGKSGTSIAIVHTRDGRKLKDIERKVGKKFEKRPIPDGRLVCERQLFHFIDKAKAVEVNEKEMESFLPMIMEKFEGLDRDEIIRRFVSLEFNRFLDYYGGKRDLNAAEGDGTEKRKKGRVEYDRFYINLGAKQELTPPRLMGILNDYVGDKSMRIGQIEILKKFSFFEIDNDYTEILLSSVGDGKEWQGYHFLVEKVKQQSRKEGKPSGKRRGRGDRRDDDRRPSRRRDRDRSFSRDKKRRKRF